MKTYEKPFDFIRAMTVDKDNVDFNISSNKTTYSPYLIDLIVSSIDFYLPIVNNINKYNTPKEMHYEYYKSILPQKYIQFPYIAKKKDKNEKAIECIAKYYEISTREAIMYLEMFTEDQIKMIVSKFDSGKTK